MRKLSIALLFSTFTILASAQPPSHFDGHTWWDYIKVLADDKMEGRDTGSRGEHAAQEYAVEQLKKAGLEPAGINGFYQPVRFVSRQIVEKDCSLTLVHDGQRESLVLGDDALIGTRILPAPEVKAPLIFVGYGLKVPEKNYDDFAGLDIKGKLVVIFSGSPTDIPGPLAAHYQTLLERWKVLRAAGAVGIISLINPASMDIPWSRISLNRTHATMDLDYPEFDETSGAQLSVTVNPASAEKFFAGSGHTFAEIAELGKDRKPLPHFPLAVSLEAKTKVETQKVESANLVAKLPGSDPTLKDEYVVLSAHIDHVGIGAPINGDSIYNGAMDDGSGSALLLDTAASFKKNPEKLRRSILFVFVTAEEKGLLGSKYFAAHPTVPPKSLVADVNVDMFLPIVPLKVLRPRRPRPRNLTISGRKSSARPRTVTQSLRPQRSVQLHPPRSAVDHHERRLRTRFARTEDLQRLVDQPLSCTVGRLEPAGRFRRGCEIRRNRAQPADQHRQRRPPSAMEARQFLSPLCHGRLARGASQIRIRGMPSGMP